MCALEVISLVLGCLLPEIAVIFLLWGGPGGMTGIRNWVGDDVPLNISLNGWPFAGLQVAPCPLQRPGSGMVWEGTVVI